MKKTLITGVTGQDGSYLSEFLLEKGFFVGNHQVDIKAKILSLHKLLS